MINIFSGELRLVFMFDYEISLFYMLIIYVCDNDFEGSVKYVVFFLYVIVLDMNDNVFIFF